MEKYFSKVPYFNKGVYCSEISLKEYKVILKSLLTQNLSDTFLVNINKLLRKNTTLSLDEINNLNFVEYFIILVFIRVISMGGELKLVFTHENKKTGVTLNLNNTIKNFIPALLLKEKKITLEDIEFTLAIPAFKKFLSFNNSLTEFYIKSATVKNYTTFEQADISLLINTLTPVSYKKIIDECISFNEQLTKLYFYNNFKKEFSISFVPHPDSILYYLKLVFNDDLQILYNDIHYLSKLENLSTDYLINCTPGEFKLHAKILEAAAREKDEIPSETWDLEKNIKT